MSTSPAADFHPKRDANRLVRILEPHRNGPLQHWSRADEVATVIPGGPVPAELHGLAFAPWQAVPHTAAGWQQLADARRLPDEPPCPGEEGLKPAAGAAVQEPDGRFWLVSPTNRFAGYVNTFPKGRQDEGLDLQATAIKEVWEESGLLVELTGFLMDVRRTETLTRYYLARRVGGSPADMGWESQAVHLVPRRRLHEFLLHEKDRPLLKRLRESD
ncbi:NUDIX hydrolase [Caldimonas tepidiphila]|uniref:NUDIX hydrolase n=1 Tax=Caldimonas tepidiphila TaxID=2315841 RepID=UPI000E5A7EC7|nr:NUDIX hydrolase [Caldimonas tepidiphila]